MKKFLILVAFLFSGFLFARVPTNLPPPDITPPPSDAPIDGFVLLFVIIALVYSFTVLKKVNLKKH